MVKKLGPATEEVTAVHLARTTAADVLATTVPDHAPTRHVSMASTSIRSVI